LVKLSGGYHAKQLEVIIRQILAQLGLAVERPLGADSVTQTVFHFNVQGVRQTL
jgi:hypothetical protein